MNSGDQAPGSTREAYHPAACLLATVPVYPPLSPLLSHSSPNYLAAFFSQTLPCSRQITYPTGPHFATPVSHFATFDTTTRAIFAFILFWPG